MPVEDGRAPKRPFVRGQPIRKAAPTSALLIWEDSGIATAAPPTPITPSCLSKARRAWPSGELTITIAIAADISRAFPGQLSARK